ncbi:MAG: hypothetical protein Q8P68_00350 [Candidatus Peregrinibacteria bacterium]|nr:hypothetical protein [Candidatus Peregrinibacteria bacterium]MDZ4244932.1 hypothetical protein [Candidatus Gracilibacteria bacterium]
MVKNISKQRFIFSSEQFWIYAILFALGVFALEMFFLGMWALPIINYSILYMAEVKVLDIIFTVLFALVFGFGAGMFFLAKKTNTMACAIGSGSGLLSFFTLLCPVCPIFFLAYFGLSTSVLVLVPYFWIFRIVALVILIIGLILLWRGIQPRKLPSIDRHLVFQKSAVALIIILFFSNQAMAISMGNKMLGKHSMGVELSGDFAKDVYALTVPLEIPFYGEELGLDYSGVKAINASISKLAIMAPKQGSHPIELNPEEMKRYIAIGTEPLITCEFCCGVKTLVRKDGTPTCGCAHSIGMRGTAAYLIRNYPEITNAEISYELMRQKSLYFPKQMQERMATELAGDSADFTPDIKYLTKDLTPLELKNLNKKAQESGFVPQDSPDMVGGC